MSKPALAIFAYRRPQSLEACMASLAACDGVESLDVSVFVDGPSDESERGLVEETVRRAGSFDGFTSLDIHYSGLHLGLGASIIEGVSHVLEDHSSVIVLEDDLIVCPGFLRFIMGGLERYAGDERVFSVCGYTNRIRLPDDYSADAYFCPRSSSWGWGTWKDRWDSVDWNPTAADLQQYRRPFAIWGGSDCPDLFRAWLEGKNDSWAIRFCLSEFIQGKLSLFPVKSLVDASAGFDGFGTHCSRYSRFRFELDERRGPFKYPDTVDVNPMIRRSALHYHSIFLRAWSRLRNLSTR